MSRRNITPEQLEKILAAHSLGAVSANTICQNWPPPVKPAKPAKKTRTARFKVAKAFKPGSGRFS